MLCAFLQVTGIILYIARWTIIVHVVLSWLIAFNVINTGNDIVRSVWIALERMTDPVYRPIRRIMPDLGGLDLAPMIVLLLIIFVDLSIANSFPGCPI